MALEPFLASVLGAVGGEMVGASERLSAARNSEIKGNVTLLNISSPRSSLDVRSGGAGHNQTDAVLEYLIVDASTGILGPVGSLEIRVIAVAHRSRRLATCNYPRHRGMRLTWLDR